MFQLNLNLAEAVWLSLVKVATWRRLNLTSLDCKLCNNFQVVTASLTNFPGEWLSFVSTGTRLDLVFWFVSSLSGSTANFFGGVGGNTS